MTRGRADAAMVWGEESPGREGEFDTQVLSPAEFLDAESSMVLGVGAVAPVVNPEGGASGLVDVSASGGKSAWKRRLSPSHRDAVRTFFAPDE